MSIRHTCIAAALLLAVPGLTLAEQPPAGGEPKDFQLPDTTTYSLPNGLDVTLIPYGRLPKAVTRLYVRTGNLNEGPDTWLADLTGEMMKQGAGDYSAEDLALRSAEMGGQLSVSVQPDQTVIGLDVLGEFAPEAVDLVAAVATDPALPESELARIRQDFLRQLSVQSSRAQTQAQAALAKMLYGEHPYGRVLPEAAQLEGYGIDDVRGYYADNFGAVRAHLYIGGRFDTPAVRTAVEDAFGDWEAGPAPLINPPATAPSLAIDLTERADAPQTTLHLGLPVIDPSAEDFIALELVNTLLGGYFSSRITSNIREDKGYTYSPRSAITTRYRTAHWTQEADVTTEHTGAALSEIYKEINRLRAEPPSDQELAGVKNYMTGVYVLRNATPAGIIANLAFLDLHGLDTDYLENYVSRVNAITAKQVTQVARTHLRPDDMALAVVGDLDTVTGQLRELETLEGVDGL